MAMHNEVLLAEENMDLRIAIDLQECKRKHSRKAIIHENDCLNMEEAINLIQTAFTASTASATVSPAEAGLQRKRAPLRCSDCHQIGHKRTSYPSRQM